MPVKNGWLFLAHSFLDGSQFSNYCCRCLPLASASKGLREYIIIPNHGNPCAHFGVPWFSYKNLYSFPKIRICSPQDVKICTLPRQVMEFILGRGALRDSDRQRFQKWRREDRVMKTIYIEQTSFGSSEDRNRLRKHVYMTYPFLNGLNMVVMQKPMAMLGE